MSQYQKSFSKGLLFLYGPEHTIILNERRDKYEDP